MDRNFLRTRVLVETDEQGELFDLILSFLDIRCGAHLAHSHGLLHRTFAVGLFNHLQENLSPILDGELIGSEENPRAIRIIRKQTFA